MTGEIVLGSALNLKEEEEDEDEDEEKECNLD